TNTSTQTGRFSFTIRATSGDKRHESVVEIIINPGMSSQDNLTFGAEIPPNQQAFFRDVVTSSIRSVNSKAGVGAVSVHIFVYGELEAMSQAYAAWTNTPLEAARNYWSQDGSGVLSDNGAIFFYTAKSWLNGIVTAFDRTSLSRVSAH